MRALNISRRAVAVAAAVFLAGGGVAVAASAGPTNGADCPYPTANTNAKIKEWQLCRFIALEGKVDALSQPPVTVTAPPVTVTQTGPTSTVTVTVAPTTTAPPTTIVPPTTTAPPQAGFPNAGTTGVPAGVTLTAYTGPMTITANGAVIDGKTITGDLRIKARDVVVKRSKINGDVRIDADDSGYSFRVEDSEIDAGRAKGQDAYDGTGVGARDFTALRVNVYNGKRSINCFLNCTVQDSFLHGQASDSTGVMHESGIRMGSGSVIRGNSIACDAPDFPPDAGCSAALTGYGDFAVVQNNTIDGNLIKAGSGGFCAYGGSSKGKPFSNGTNHITFTNNVFERGTSKSDHGLYVCGYYGSITDFDPAAPGNAWSGNRWDSGELLTIGQNDH